MDRFKKLYDSMLESGELKQVFRSMTGEWELDEKKFISAQTELESLVDGYDFEINE